MCWHNSHKANYRDSTGTQEEYTNNKERKKTPKKDNKSHLKNKSINIIIVKDIIINIMYYVHTALTFGKFKFSVYFRISCSLFWSLPFILFADAHFSSPQSSF